MKVRFLLGPAGSGKTFRCLEEVRSRLEAEPEGAPMLFLAPKQATFQLERLLLTSLPGYTRLQILSFDRLATFIIGHLTEKQPRLLQEEGRLMVLRALLEKCEDQLRLFHASARLPGFARQLSRVLRDLQRHKLSATKLRAVASQATGQLAAKLFDLALLLTAYADWLRVNELEDAQELLNLAAEISRPGQIDQGRLASNAELPATSSAKSRLGGLWLDGFAEMTPQELDLLAAVAPLCDTVTLAFCIEGVPRQDSSWLSMWSVVHRTFQQCHARFEPLAGGSIAIETLFRNVASGRFARSPPLAHLERHWANPQPYGGVPSWHVPDEPPAERLIPASQALRLAKCADPESEAELAAHEILDFVHAGGRYREAAVILRTLTGYHEVLRMVFDKYRIPFFLDRREGVAHHPLAELTRGALRVLAYDWTLQDWFGVLKTGLLTEAEANVDWIENLAMARGWGAEFWRNPVNPAVHGEESREVEPIRSAWTRPMLRLDANLGGGLGSPGRPSGKQVASALREFLADLDVGSTLERWAHVEGPGALHLTVFEEIHAWLDNVELAFPDTELPLREWLPILEAGLTNLTAGAIPPALDQVLVGSIDRSRNPELRLVVLPGMNEGVFPAPPATAPILTESDQQELGRLAVWVGLEARQRIAHERFYGYVACTRAAERLVVTWAGANAEGGALNPSPFIGHLHRLFPDLPLEDWRPPESWRKARHATGIAAALMATPNTHPLDPWFENLLKLPPLARLRDRWETLPISDQVCNLPPAVAARLYCREPEPLTLRTSVSRIERFAQCPFKFFIESGLRARERDLFELDVRGLGQFQHQVLEAFHRQVKAREEGNRWHDLDPDEAAECVRALAREHAKKFGDGLLQATSANQFRAEVMGDAIAEFVRTAVRWMPQYDFEPWKAELKFGLGGEDEGSLPPWRLPLPSGRQLHLVGVIDRVDVSVDPLRRWALYVVIDYKSNEQKLDRVLMEHGLQLQLMGYLKVLASMPELKQLLQVKALVPAGAFYVGLRGWLERASHRDGDTSNDMESDGSLFQHRGRFDAAFRKALDNRGGASYGSQFSYRIKKDGMPSRVNADMLDADAFRSQVDRIESHLLNMGERILAGDIQVDPYSYGGKTPCTYCEFKGVCRIDPWEHQYRVLSKPRSLQEGGLARTFHTDSSTRIGITKG